MTRLFGIYRYWSLSKRNRIPRGWRVVPWARPCGHARYSVLIVKVSA